MKKWSTSCKDWEKRIVSGQSLIPFDPLFEDEARAGLDVFKELRIVDMAGSPTMGEVCRPWIFDFVSHLFGSYDVDSGRRLIQEYFMLISKKNTKSTTAAGIMMTALLRNWRQSGEFLILAPTIEIANNSFYPARDMVRHDEELSVLLDVKDNLRTIIHRNTGATLKVVAADNDTVGGKKAIGVLVDELWLFGKQPNAENMLREATGGLASRPEGFTIFLSTQSDAPPQGVFRQKLMYARQVRDGKLEDNKFLPVLYEFPDKMLKEKRHRDPKYFYITNPNLGASVDEEFLVRELGKADSAGEESMLGFLSKHLNVEIGMALRSDRWAGADYWEQTTDKTLTLEVILKRSDAVVCGIDGGGLDDLLGFVVMGRCRTTRKWLVWGRAWAHRIVFQRRKELVTTLQELEQLGEISVVDNPGQDVYELGQIVRSIYAKGLFPEKHAIGVDAAGIGDIIDELTGPNCNIPESMVTGVSQGYRLTGAIKTTERKLAGGEMLHCDQKLMAFAVSSARVEPKSNAIAVTKQASGSAKIDPVMALFDAVSLMALNPSSMNISAFLANPIIV